MQVKVKLVVFEHPNPTEWDVYASYCPATRDYCARGKTVQQVIDYVTRNLCAELENRCHFINLTRMGWKISETSAIPPIFADEEVVAETERLFEIKIENPIIIELDVELPPSRRTIGT